MTSEACFGVGDSHLFADVHSVNFNGFAGNAEQIRNLFDALPDFDQVRHFNFGCREIDIFCGQPAKERRCDGIQVLFQDR